MLQMLQIDPSLRPTAAELYSKFSREFKRSKAAEFKKPPSFPNTITQTFTTNDKDRETDLSWADPNSPSMTVFQDYSHTTPTNWDVLATIVNNLNNRLALVSYNADLEIVRFKLCTPSAEVLWEKTSPKRSRVEDIVPPTFSDDGNLLAVYSTGGIDIFNACRGNMVRRIELENDQSFKVVSIAIGRNLKRIAIAREGGNSGSLERIVFEQTNGCKAVLVFSLPQGVLDASIAFTAKDSRLVTVMKEKSRGSDLGEPCFISCWNTSTCALIRSCEYWGRDGRLTGPIVPLNWDTEPSVLIPLCHVERFDQRNTLHVWSGDGQQMNWGYTDRIVHTVSGGKVILLRKNKHIQLWTNDELFDVAKLECDDMPMMQEIKGFCVLKNQIILVLHDEQFILLRRE